MVWRIVQRVDCSAFLFPASIVLLTWLIAVSGTAVVFVRRKGAGHPLTVRGFVSFMVPGEMVRHRSLKLDIAYYISRHLLDSLLRVPFFAVQVGLAVWSHAALATKFGDRVGSDPSIAIWALLMVLVFLVFDLTQFLGHYALHKLKPFWQFHKTHHSVEFLIPLSARRNHPFEYVFQGVAASVNGGLAIGILSYVFAIPVFDATVYGLSVSFIGELLSFHHLRHSHIDMSYGRLERWFLSPAQHQLHHSQEVRHWDKNFGLTLAIWDHLAGTFMHSESAATFRTGLPVSEGEGYDTVFGLYWTPVRNNIRLAQAGLTRIARRSLRMRGREPVKAQTVI